MLYISFLKSSVALVTLLRVWVILLVACACCWPILSMVLIAWAISLTTLFISFKVFLMLSVASLDCSASFLTSSATTAKPRPCSPALAASIEAFKLRRLVSSAISVIMLIAFKVSVFFSFKSLACLTEFSPAATNSADLSASYCTPSLTFLIESAISSTKNLCSSLVAIKIPPNYDNTRPSFIFIVAHN